MGSSVFIGVSSLLRTPQYTRIRLLYTNFIIVYSPGDPSLVERSEGVAYTNRVRPLVEYINLYQA
jgi:hypothetical protein